MICFRYVYEAVKTMSVCLSFFTTEENGKYIYVCACIYNKSVTIFILLSLSLSLSSPSFLSPLSLPPSHPLCVCERERETSHKTGFFVYISNLIQASSITFSASVKVRIYSLTCNHYFLFFFISGRHVKGRIFWPCVCSGVGGRWIGIAKVICYPLSLSLSLPSLSVQCSWSS